jgi:hypothetical protein
MFPPSRLHAHEESKFAAPFARTGISLRPIRVLAEGRGDRRPSRGYGPTRPRASALPALSAASLLIASDRSIGAMPQLVQG